MILGVAKEILDREKRVAAIPETVAEFVKLGFEVIVETGAGLGALKSDAEYEQAGAKIVGGPEEIFSKADVVLKVKQLCFNEKLGKHEADLIGDGKMLVTFLHPASPSSHEIVRKLQAKNVTSLTMDGIPRTSRAQRMDALTSMSTITGYKSVLIAANSFPKFIPIIGTAVGTVKPATFLIVGIGVVGLQAIATAKRLGGTVRAMDIREEARVGADSLGAEIVGFDVPADLAHGEGGYAKALPDEWLNKEREQLATLLEKTDILILSALVPGEVAPILITKEMIGMMKPGSVVMDISVDQGGNCAATHPGREIEVGGVVINGTWNIPGSMPVHASWLYANNLMHYMKNLFKNGVDAPDFDDDIVRHSLVTRDGKIVHAGALKAMA